MLNSCKAHLGLSNAEPWRQEKISFLALEPEGIGVCLPVPWHITLWSENFVPRMLSILLEFFMGRKLLLRTLVPNQAKRCDDGICVTRAAGSPNSVIWSSIATHSNIWHLRETGTLHAGARRTSS